MPELFFTIPCSCGGIRWPNIAYGVKDCSAGVRLRIRPYSERKWQGSFGIIMHGSSSYPGSVRLRTAGSCSATPPRTEMGRYSDKCSHLGQVGRLADAVHAAERDGEGPRAAAGRHDVTQDVNAPARREDLDERLLEARLHRGCDSCGGAQRTQSTITSHY